MAHDSAAIRINKIARAVSAKTYIEIGVQAGKTLLNLDIPFKVGVDPNFVFDTEEYRHESQLFYECTSDEFFNSTSWQRKFDIIFLDGLHTFEQTYRDFCNCLHVSHERTIIIIDDTVPYDLYSSLRSQKICELRREREAPGSQIAEWRGDVYKILLLLKLFHGTLSYSTVEGNGPAQTIVWVNQSYNVLSALSQRDLTTDYQRLCLEYLHRFGTIDYQWLLENDDIFQKIKFDYFYDQLVNSEPKRGR